MKLSPSAQLRYHAIRKDKTEIKVSAYATFYGNPVLEITDVDWRWMTPETKILVIGSIRNPNYLYTKEQILGLAFIGGMTIKFDTKGEFKKWMSVYDYFQFVNNILWVTEQFNRCQR